MNRLADHGIQIFRTDQDGTIIATSDGKNIEFNKKATRIAKTPPGSSSSGGGSQSSVEETKPEPTTNSSEEQAEVFGTNTGSKYHKSTCHHLKKSKIVMTLEEAKAQGLEACGVCKSSQ